MTITTTSALRTAQQFLLPPHESVEARAACLKRADALLRQAIHDAILAGRSDLGLRILALAQECRE
ncbi:MAG TPA: hypothetical protein VGN52_01060 [Burkholderiales bacterium]|jgi:hypothetical protein